MFNLTKKWQYRLAVLAVVWSSVGAGYGLWLWQVKGQQIDAFNSDVGAIRDDIASKAAGYEQIISNTRRLVTAAGISKADWDAYYQAVDLNLHPGLSTVSYSQLVTRAEKAVYERQNYRIFPPGNKDEYLPVTFVTPPSPAFLGFDSGTSSPERYAWIVKARDSGQLQRSDAYSFKASATAEPVPLMFITVPIYRLGSTTLTTEERRQNYAGTILGTLRLDQLVPALLSNSALTAKFRDIEIYDHTGEGATAMGNTDPQRSAGEYPLHKSIDISLGNRPIKVELGGVADDYGKLPSPLWLLLAIPLSGVVLVVGERRRRQP